MREVYIYGTGRIAEAYLLFLKVTGKNLEMNLKGCVVTNNKARVKEIEGVPIYSLSDVSSKKDIYFYIAVREKYYSEIEKNLIEEGFCDNYEKVDINQCVNVLEEKWLKNKRNVFFKNNIEFQKIKTEEYLMFLALQNKNGSIDFEINLVDHCNLNCQCCNHFSPIAKENYIDTDILQKQLRRVSELFNNCVGNIMLLGGEPLLHKKICECMLITRKEFPTAHIQIYTNGILLPKMSDQFWETCRKADVQIMLTRYPITFDYDICIERANKENVEISYNWESEDKQKTTYRLPIELNGGNNPYTNFALCDHANRCIVLKNERFYTCPFGAYVNILNERFDKHFPQNDKNSISIYEVDSKEAIIDFLKKPIKLCEYCNVCNYKWDIPWRVSRRELKEWVD